MEGERHRDRAVRQMGETDLMTTFGAPARDLSTVAEYESLLARRDEPGERRLARAGFALVAPVLGYVLVRAAIAVIEAQFSSGRSGPVFDEVQTQALAVWGALSLGLLVLGDRVASRFLSKNADDRQVDLARTGSFLDRLPSSFNVLRELRVSDAGIVEHVVVGPTGLFVVCTDRYEDEVVVDGRRARSGRRSLAKAVARARVETAAVSRLAGVPATPVVCVHGADVTVLPGATRPTVEGVRFCAARDLAALLSERSEVFPEIEVHQIAIQLVWS